LEDFTETIKQPCTFTGLREEKDPSTGKYKNFNGVDRIDSSKGYIKGNIQPAQGWVNRLKGNLPEDEFAEKIELIYNHWAKTRLNKRKK